VNIAGLMAVADGNGIMPPKSTWFDPKPRDGLLIHELHGHELQGHDLQGHR
jgi:uncharacterized protein (DUF1015 family)